MSIKKFTHKNQIFNSLENSFNPRANTNCFVKINQVKNPEKEMFYMSSDHNAQSKTSNLDNNQKSKR